MNIDIFSGIVINFGGKFKEIVGGVIGDKLLQSEGVVDQVGGIVQKIFGEVWDVIEGGVCLLIDYVCQFLCECLFVVVVVVGVLGIVLFNIFCGK